MALMSRDFPEPVARRPAVFIDKDGTLVEHVPHNVSPLHLRFMPGAIDALQLLALSGYALIVVTNQSGIGHGFFTEQQFDALRQALDKALWSSAGLRLDGFFHCPHIPAPDGTPTCPCRKPEPGLFQRAERVHHIDMQRSWMVGDTLDDVEAAHRAGCHGMLLHSGGETEWRRGPLREPELVAADWGEVARALAQRCRPSASLGGSSLFPPPDD